MVKRAITAYLLLVAACAWLCAPARALVFRGGPKAWHEAVVGVIVLHGVGASAGQGFVFGDGTWVATAAHLIISKAEGGKHQATGVPTVYSHAFGDMTDASIAALDLERDVAILRVPWAGHPSLRFAPDSKIRSLDGAFVGAWTRLLDDSKVDAAPRLRDLPLWVEVVGPEKGTPEVIIFHRDYTVGQGWSGAPLVLGEDDAAVGILSGALKDKDRKGGTRSREYVVGCAAGPIRQLARSAKQDAGPPIDIQPYVERENSEEAFAHAVKAAKARFQDQWDVVFSEAESFVRLRPESPTAHSSLAGAASELGKHEIAREHFQKALELAPRSWRAHARYSFFLEEVGEKDEAIAEARKAVELYPNAALPLLVLAGVLQAKGEYEESEAVVRQALELEPSDAFTWYALSNVLVDHGRMGDAVKAIRKAVALYPGAAQLRRALARTLAKAGKLDEAEKHFRELVEAEPDDPVVWFSLAEFLAEHRPRKTSEALRAVNKAIALNTAGRIPAADLEELREDLENRTSSRVPPVPD